MTIQLNKMVRRDDLARLLDTHRGEAARGAAGLVCTSRQEKAVRRGAAFEGGRLIAEVSVAQYSATDYNNL